MRILLIIAWLFVGLTGVIFHLGPGKEQMELDRVDAILSDARKCVAEQSWDDAIESFDEALRLLPAEKVTQGYQVQLEKAKAQMMNKQLPAARQALAGLLKDVREHDDSDPNFVSEVRSTLANSQFYMTWLMRCEGLPKSEWMPEIEAARQNYVQVATEASEQGDQKLADRAKEDVEAAIRLARMDLKELQGLPLPSQ